MTGPARARGDTAARRAAEERRALLYDTAAIGLTLYAHAAFRLRTLGGERFRLRPGTLFLANHVCESDVPVFVGGLYPHACRPAARKRLVHFTPRDDLYARGFFAGMPLHLPLWARRLLFPLGVGPVLDRWLPCPPIRSARRMLVADLLRAAPDTALGELLPQADVGRLRERAAALGHAPPRCGRDVLRGSYADLLWWVVDGEDAPSERARELFAQRAAQARADFERVVEIVRSGGMLLMCPEGRASPHGALQPVRRGAALLVRRARPERVQPLCVAYDPLTRGRPWAYVGVGEAVEAPARDGDEAIRALLARTVPLTVGQVVADALDRGCPPGLERRLGTEVEHARAAGRPVDPQLLDPAVRLERLDDALRTAAEHPQRLPRLAACYRSVRDADAGAASRPPSPRTPAARPRSEARARSAPLLGAASAPRPESADTVLER